MRICSLLPSATEIVCQLGLGDHLVAVTHECDYPPQILGLPQITRNTIDQSGASSREIHHHITEALHQGSSIYDLDQALLEALHPDLVLTQELCDVCAVSYQSVQKAIRLLDGQTKILSLEPTNLNEILQSIHHVGQMTGAGTKAGQVVKDLQQRLTAIADAAAAAPSRPRVLGLEWLDPPFVGGHWVPEMIKVAAGADGLGTAGVPSFETSWSRITEYDPQIVILMPCGFDLEQTLREKDRADLSEHWNSLQAVRSGQVYAVDGSAYFNRPGPRIVDGLQILAEIIQPQLFARKSPPSAWQLLD